MSQSTLLRLTVAALSWAIASQLVLAADSTTDAERSYFDLRRSSEQVNQLLAERWYNLIKTQQWTDATKKYSTNAKYLEHDPELQWVKLRVVRGTGDQRVVKDLMVPMAKLSPASRSRVRQIAGLHRKIAEAIAAEQAAADEDEDSRSARGRRPALGGESRRGSEVADFQDAEVTSRLERAREREPARPAPPRRRRGATGSRGQLGPPPPMIVPGLETDVAGESPDIHSAGGSQDANAQRPLTAAPSQVQLPDDQPWRTSYSVFRENFAVQQTGRDSWNIEWGQLTALEQASARAEVMRGRNRADSDSEVMIRGNSIGQFVWDATLAMPPDDASAISEALDLPPLPHPLNLVLRLDDERALGQWQQIQPGSRVRFAGRFIGFSGRHGIVAAVRLLD